MYVSLRMKFLSLLFGLIAGMALMMNEQSTNLIYEKTQEIFQQRVELMRESVLSYWDSEKNSLLNNAILYAETEKIVSYSAYGLHNLLQKEISHLVSKTGFYDMEIQLKNGQLISSHFKEIKLFPPIDMNNTDFNLSNIEVQNKDEGLLLVAEVPIHKTGEFIGKLFLRRKLDDTRLQKMARNLQANVSLAVRDIIVATSMNRKEKAGMIKAGFQNLGLKTDFFNLRLNGRVYSIGRVSCGKTETGAPLDAYIAISQNKMLSLVRSAGLQNMQLTLVILIISLILSVIFSEKVLLSRIRQVRDGANIIADGDLNFRLPESGKDELEELASAFNDMAEKLHDNRDKLTKNIKEVEKLANYIRNILRSLRTGVITWTMEGKVETANPTAKMELEEYYGDIKGVSLKGFIKCLKPESRKELIKALRNIKHTLEPNYLFELEFEEKKSGIKVLQGSFSYLRDNDKKPYGIVLTLNNITQRKIIEKQLYHADKLSSIGQLAASVAHEIKNPLASIKTLGQLLQEEIAEETESREYVNVIVSEVNRLNSVVEQLLKYAKPEGSSFKTVNVSEILDPVIALVHHEADRHKVKLETDYSSSLTICVDAEKIKQVFLNLIFNGIQAMHDGGILKIRAFKKDASPWTSFQISDSGTGMPEDVRKRVFDPFFTTKQRGTGLGLAIVKKIIDVHGGKIEVISDIGKGTTFTFYLPYEDRKGR